jgi:hypothetical protein
MTDKLIDFDVLLLDQADAAVLKNAQDLGRGDVFLFRGHVYLVLSCFTDKRTTQTILTTIALLDAAVPLRRVAALRLFRTFKVGVLTTLPIELQRFDNVPAELTTEMETELEELKRKDGF